MSKEPEYMNAISGLIQYFVVGWETKQFDYEKAFNIVEQALSELEELKEAYDKDTLKLVDELGVLRSKIKRFFELHKDMPALKLAEYNEYVKLSRELKKEGDFWKVGEE